MVAEMMLITAFLTQITPEATSQVVMVNLKVVALATGT
jgi:hypothetical protein